MGATIALEVAPPVRALDDAHARADVHKLKTLLQKSGLASWINTLLIPHMVPEDPDRPRALEERLDSLEARDLLAQTFETSFILTQVSVFTPLEALEQRLRRLRERGVERVVFVGAPRNWESLVLTGPSPGEAIRHFRHLIPSRGAVLIPTRVDEKARFQEKLEAGATFALTQLLFSDSVVPFLRSLGQLTPRPEVLLSFGYVPRVEQKVGLLRWLIQDTISPLAQGDLEQVARLAALPFRAKKGQLVELYRRVVEGVSELGFPVGLHFECPYGVSEPALETFAAMLEAWSPQETPAPPPPPRR